MHGVEAILFDFYNTLGVDRDPNDCVAARVLAEFGYELDFEVVREAQARASGWLDGPEPIDHSAHSDSHEAYNRYLHAVHEPWMRSLGVDPFHPGLFERMCAEWDDPERILLFDDALPALTRLRHAGYRLGIVSNWSWGLQEVLDRTGLTPLMDVIVISARAGYRKPHPAIYRQALDLLGLAAERVLFVGDSPHADIAGPQAAGMQPVHIDRFDYHGPRDGVLRIKRLDELEDLLGLRTVEDRGVQVHLHRAVEGHHAD